MANHQFLHMRWALLLVVAGWSGLALSHGQKDAGGVLSSDGRDFSFVVSEQMTFHGGFGTTIVYNQKTQQVLSAEGVLVSPPEAISENTPFGLASKKEVVLRFDKQPVELLLRLGSVKNVLGLLVQAGVRNTGTKPFQLESLHPVMLTGQVTGSPRGWLLTALSVNPKQLDSVVSLDELSTPFEVDEQGGFYSKDGKGFLFGPVGEPIAYVGARITHEGQGKVTFVYSSAMSGVQVEPGETRWGQEVVLLAEPPRQALPRWVEWVAQTHGARTDKGALSGWGSWTFHGRDVTGQDVLAQVETVLASDKRLRPSVMEIDDGYMDFGAGKINYKMFPEPLSFYAERIASTGARPGVILNFNCPPGTQTIEERIKTAVKNGFTFLKINRTGLNLPPEPIPRKTSFQRMREVFDRLRQAAGEETYLLYNEGRPERASVGRVDASRTGQMVKRSTVRESMTDVLRAYELNGRWFAVDNDSYFMGTDIANVSKIAGGWPLVRTWMSMVGLSGGLALTADPWHWDSFKPYWRNVEVMTPPATERMQVMDLCTSKEWPRLVGHVKRAWGDMTVALLWNPGSSERPVTLNFAEAGMDPRHRYAVWSFWDNRYLGVAQGSWTTPALAPSASQHLCFTPLDRVPNQPTLIGSSFHIFCGATEITKVTRRRGEMEIQLSDAGARNGALYISSRHQPVWKGVEGCVVREVASAGEYVWRVSLSHRQVGAPQRVTLGIVLPVTAQPWFWILCSILMASLIFGAWKYVAWTHSQLAVARLEQQTARQQERVRIAADLHDELGAGLTRILMLSEPTSGENLEKIRRAALEMTRELDEIVWAVNPKNDRLDRLAMYLDAYALELLELSEIDSRVDFPVPLPQNPISATVRHGLFLAFKEALTNVIRHSGAKCVQLCLTVKPRSFTVTLKDDGRGFDVPVIGGERTDTGNGLDNMRERLAKVGGCCRISSQMGQGTCVEFELPLEQ
jgi:signal transduction histidine kinase